MEKETSSIEYLDRQASTVPFESWKTATLILDGGVLQVVDLEKQVLNYQFDNIGAVNLLTMTGGEPARYTFISKSDTEIITIRPKRRYLRLIKQVNELRNLGELVNVHAGRKLVDLKQIDNLRLITMVGATACGAIILVSLFQMLKSLVLN